MIILNRSEDRAGFTGLVIGSKKDHQGQDQDDQGLEPNALSEETFFNLSHQSTSISAILNIAGCPSGSFYHILSEMIAIAASR